MDFGPIHTTRADGMVSAVIDSPPLHLVDGELIGGLIAMLDAFEPDGEVRVVVFSSADPQYFLMHGDVEVLAGMVPPAAAPTGEPNVAAAAFDRLHHARYATIGVLDGVARGGGCEFLSALDIRIGSDRSVIGQPEVAMGILPGAGGTARWPRAIGRAAALELLLTGRDMHADEALQKGWLQAVFPAADVAAGAHELARRIASMPAASIAAIKHVVDVSLGATGPALVAENEALTQLMSTGAHTARMRRFLGAGGQTRDGESGDFAALLEVMAEPRRDPDRRAD